MNTDSIQNNFFNGQDINVIVPFLIWGYIGLVLSVLVDIVRNKEKIKRTGGFNLGFWIQDNLVRVISSILIVLVGVLFSEDLLGIKGNLGAFAAGFITDKVIEMLIKFRSNVDLTRLFTKNKS